MKTPLLILAFAVFAHASYAQKDTLYLSFEEAEKTFLQNNLSLVASKYNIDASTALIKQAKLWDNPVLLTDQTLYDGKFFRHSKLSDGSQVGEIYVQVQQLIRTAGKIRKLSTLATTNAHISELQFEQVMFNLRYTLKNDLYQSNQLLLSINLYEKENEQLKKLLTAMNAQLQAGNISQKDFLRIQSLQASTLQEQNEYRKQLSDVQSELHTLLQSIDHSFVKAILPTTIDITRPAADSVLAFAMQNNPDYLLEKANLLYSRNSLDYQRALRKPDVTVGVEYDKVNSYVPNYYGLTLALPLPFINRNQGNIASAAFTVKQQETLVNQRGFKLTNDINNALNKLQLNLDLQKSIDPDFIRKYDLLMQNAFNAYQQRQMNLLDFLDLFEAYKNTQLKYLQQQFNLQTAKEDINLLAGRDVIK
jgi:outer membrane protein, heavy metal efflux system